MTSQPFKHCTVASICQPEKKSFKLNIGEYYPCPVLLNLYKQVRQKNKDKYMFIKSEDDMELTGK